MLKQEYEFKRLMYEAGFKTYTALAQEIGMNSSNISKNVKGAKNNTAQLSHLFRYANVLKVPIEKLLWLFHRDAMLKNHEIAMENALDMSGEEEIEKVVDGPRFFTVRDILSAYGDDCKLNIKDIKGKMLCTDYEEVDEEYMTRFVLSINVISDTLILTI